MRHCAFFTLGTFHSGPKDYTDSNYSFCMQQFYKIFSKIVLGGIKTEKVPLAINCLVILKIIFHELF